jgi:hypothetical protein
LQIGPDIYPDYHFLLIAPNLGAEWLFDAARRYWDRFRPTILPDFDFLALIPPDRTVTVTVIARRDTAQALAMELALYLPNAYYDPVVYDLLEDMRAALNRRADAGEPFGVPMSQPTATGDPNATFVPTPRLPTTRPPAGFVTEAPPTIPPTPTGTPPPSFTPEDNPPVPITPTRGPVIRG